MVRSEKFHNGAGFDLHARTTIQDYFSFMETAALRVGDDTLEMYSDHFYINGVKLTPADLPFTFGGEFKYTISDAPARDGQNAKYYQYYKVDLHENSSVLFKFYKEYLTISISAHPDDFEDSVGLLGEFHSGEMIDRDGKVMTDFTAYGFEWQVNPEDGMLFREARSPQLPFEQCRLPTQARPARRNLRQNKAFYSAAVKACAHVSGGDRELCVDDVLQTGDVGLGNLW